MATRVIVTSKVTRQIAEIATWWATHRSAEQAAHWLDRTEEVIAGLGHERDRCPLAQENAFYDLPLPVRQLNFGLSSRATHRILFEVRDDGIYVLAVRHLAQDYLSPDDF